jgi:formamidopyrimidine-DNA glycosylase
VRRHGKFLFVEFEGGGSLLLHFGMSGRPGPLAAGGWPPHARLRIEFEDGGRFAYISPRMLGEVAIVEDVDAAIRERRLGPDALAVGKVAFCSQLGRHRGMLKPLLMDQSNVAGLGNLYVDELLFQAGHHPRRCSGELTDADRVGLYRAMRRILRASIRRNADLFALPRTYLLRDRAEGRPCPRCRLPLARIVLGGRGTVFCPSCQSL